MKTKLSHSRYWIGWLFFLGTLLHPEMASAIDPSAGTNAANVIYFPTALNQVNNHTIRTSLDVVDIGKPDMRVENLGYGYQLGDLLFQLDVHAITRPKLEHFYSELRIKLRVLPLDEIRTTIALGLLGRHTEDDVIWDTLNERRASLFFIATNEAYLFGSNSMLSNFYLDNVHANLGLKVEVYQFIMAIAEVDYYHSTPQLPDRNRGRIGFEIEGEQNFFFQLFYADTYDNVLVQLGTTF